MAMNKICPRCNTVFKYGEQCPNRCSKKRRKLDQKIYSETQRKNSDFYQSKAWKKIRGLCIAKDNICLWSYYNNNRVIPGRDVHHIIEVEDDDTRKFDINNLIFLSKQSHSEIHKLYKTDKATTQQRLFAIIKKHRAAEQG